MACIKDSPNYWRSQAFPPSQAVLNFEQNWKKCVLGAEGGKEGKIARVVAGWRVEPQANRKFVIRSRVLCNNYFKGFSTVSQILLILIVCAGFEWHIQLQMGRSIVCDSTMTNHTHHVRLSVKWFHFTMLSIVTCWLLQCCWPSTGHGVSLLCRKISSGPFLNYLLNMNKMHEQSPLIEQYILY